VHVRQLWVHVHRWADEVRLALRRRAKQRSKLRLVQQHLPRPDERHGHVRQQSVRYRVQLRPGALLGEVRRSTERSRQLQLVQQALPAEQVVRRR
jgi:hypothetical protein